MVIHLKERCDDLKKKPAPLSSSGDRVLAQPTEVDAIKEIRTAIAHLSAAIEALARWKA